MDEEKLKQLKENQEAIREEKDEINQRDLDNTAEIKQEEANEAKEKAEDNRKD